MQGLLCVPAQQPCFDNPKGMAITTRLFVGCQRQHGQLSPVEEAGRDVHDPLLGLVPLPQLAGIRVRGHLVLRSVGSVRVDRHE